jgi:S1-C subfamily serine protease
MYGKKEIILLAAISLGMVNGLSNQGCAPTTRQSMIAIPPPISVVADSIGMVSVTRFQSDIVPGTVIGAHHVGILEENKSDYYAQGSVTQEMGALYRKAAEQELSAAGYAVAKSSTSSVFGSEEDETWKAKFLIGATFTDINLNTYAQYGKQRTDVSVKLKWELFCRETQKVIYDKKSMGTSSIPLIDPNPLVIAVRNSFKFVLADTTFVQAVRKNSSSVNTNLDLPELPMKISTFEDSLLTVEQIVGKSIPSVLAVKTARGHGSGFLVGDSGLIITNYHVIENNTKVTILLYDGSEVTALTVRIDPQNDIALLRIDGKIDSLKCLPLCLDATTRVGQEVIAIGAPLSLALSHTVSKGIVSGIREVEKRRLIQTDVAINPGNSGGPIINMRGRVIGIATLKVSGTGIEGLGFAIPIDEALSHLNVKVMK